VKREAGANLAIQFRRCPRNGKQERFDLTPLSFALGKAIGAASIDAPASPETGLWRGIAEKLLRSASCANPVLGILVYSTRTLRFLRSVFAQPAFARDAFQRFR
jgi:hypothetical protein